MQRIKISQATAARRQVYFLAKDVNDPASPKTGLTFAAADVQVTKNGATPANSAGSVTEVSSTAFPGLYYYLPTTTEVNALGFMGLNFKHASMVAQTQLVQIIGYDEYVTNLPVDLQTWIGVAPNALSAAGNVKADLEEWRASVPAVLTSTLVQTNVNTVTAGAVGRAAFAQDAKDMFREIGRDAVAAAAAGTVTLGASASAVASTYNDCIVAIVAGTGAGQARRITAYTAAKVASVVPNWTTTPSSVDSVYELYYDGGSNVRTWSGATANATTVNALVSGRVDASVGAMAANVLTAAAIASAALTSVKFGNDVNSQVARTNTAQAGSTATTIKLDAAASAVDNYYNELICYIVSGTGAGQSRQVTGYVGATKVATIDAAWATTPDATSVFQLLPTASGGISGTVDANVVTWQGTSPSTLSAAGNVKVDLEEWLEAVPQVLSAGFNVRADVVSWRGVTPNALVSGRVDASVGAMAANVVTAAAIASAALTAAKFATDAIDANALAASAVTEIQTGLATSANQTALSADIAAVQSDTNDIQGRLPAALVAGRMDSTVGAYQAGQDPGTQVWDTNPGAHAIAGSFGELVTRPTGAVVANGGNGPLTFCTNLAATANDYYKDAWVCFLSGALVGQVHKITAYNGTTKFVTFTTAFTATPAAADRFIIVNK